MNSKEQILFDEKIFLGIIFLLLYMNTGFTWTIEPINKEQNKPRLNLVFCPLHYSDKQDFLRDIAVVLERLKKIKPFDELMDVIRTWQVQMLPDEGEKNILRLTVPTIHYGPTSSQSGIHILNYCRR